MGTAALRPQCGHSDADRAMKIHLNGEAREVEAGIALSVLIEEAGLAGRRVAIEVNGSIVPRSLHPGHRLAEGDRIEIVHALGGG
jgi:sulfur carrier protein